MTARVYRITKADYASSPADMLSGAGARRYGGRWNSPGRPAVYASGSIALATLELVVHLGSTFAVPNFSIISLEIPEELILAPKPSALPQGWDRPAIHPGASQTFGNFWLESCESAVLQIPSVVIPGEANYLLNPLHPDFSRIKAGQIKPLPLDPRLIGLIDTAAMGVGAMGMDAMGAENMGIENMGIENMRVELRSLTSWAAHARLLYSLGLFRYKAALTDAFKQAITSTASSPRQDACRTCSLPLSSRLLGQSLGFHAA